MDLSKLTDKHLKDELDAREKKAQEELKRIQDEKEELARIERSDMISLVIKHKDVLKQFMKHEMSSCPSIGYSRHGTALCALCAIDDLEEWQDDIEIEIEITLKEI